MTHSMVDPYSKYVVTAVVKATQSIQYDHESCTIEYGSIDEIIENYDTQVYDTQENIVVASFSGDIDEDELADLIRQSIEEYETKKGESVS